MSSIGQQANVVREKNLALSEHHMQHINTPFEQNAKVINDRVLGIYNYHLA
jgi:hypothetical protein